MHRFCATEIHFFIIVIQNFYFSQRTGHVSNQITHFLDQIQMPLMNQIYLGHTLVQRFDNALQASELAELRPKLHVFGSLLNGLCAFDSDLDVFLKFEALSLDVLDYETSMLALLVIRRILERKMGFQIGDEFLFGARRCPIISLDFEACFSPQSRCPFGNVKYQKCDIR